MEKQSGNARHKKFKNALIMALSEIGCFVWNNETGSIEGKDRYVSYGFKGSSDIIGVLPNGRFIGVEVKTGCGTQRKEQKAFQVAVSKRMGAYYVAQWKDEPIEQAVIKTIADIYRVYIRQSTETGV